MQYTISFTVDIPGEQDTADRKARQLGNELYCLLRQTETLAGRKATLEPRDEDAYIETTETDPATGEILRLRVVD